jgi:hypothetical protein
MTSEPGDWTTPSQAEGERDDEPEWKRHAQTVRSTPSQAEGERDETAEEREPDRTGGRDRSPDTGRSAGAHRSRGGYRSRPAG